MTSKPEVEIKFAVQDIPALQRKLRACGFRRLTTRTREQNTLFDFPDRRLQAYGELLRIRTYGKCSTLTHKARSRPGRHKSRMETETQVADAEKLRAIFLSLGLQPIFIYEKFRAEWTGGAGHVVIDQTPIGDFAEIEGPPRWIDKTAAALGVARADYITQNYAELFLQWKRNTGSLAHEMTFRTINKNRRVQSSN